MTSPVQFERRGLGVPQATIVIPAFNAVGFIEESLQSVLHQTVSAIELVVVDDHSEDGTDWLVKRFLESHAPRFTRVVLARHSDRKGPARARDTGMALCESPAALLLDADNLIYPRCVERCISALESSGAAFVYPILRRIGSDGALVSAYAFDPKKLARGNYIDMLSLLRISLWRELGAFPDLEYGLEDFALWLTLIERGFEGAQVPEILGEYRVHPRSRTFSTYKPHEPEVLETLERRFPWIRLR